MTKHQRVQITPVAVRAMFCVKDRLSAGRVKSLMPASTMLHCPEVNSEALMVARSISEGVLSSLEPWKKTLITRPLCVEVFLPEVHGLDTHGTIPQSLQDPFCRSNGRISRLVSSSQ